MSIPTLIPIVPVAIIHIQRIRSIDKWEVIFKTKCGPRCAIGSTVGKALAVAWRETLTPQRPVLAHVN